MANVLDGLFGVREVRIDGTPATFRQVWNLLGGWSYAEADSVDEAGNPIKVLELTSPSSDGPSLTPYVGGGHDGNLTASSGVTTLTKDTYYDTITLSGTAEIDCNQYKLYCRVFDATNAKTGAIHCDGANGVAANPGEDNGGRTGGAARVAHTLGGSGAGGASGTAGNGGGGNLGHTSQAGGVASGAELVHTYVRDLFKSGVNDPTSNPGSVNLIQGGAGGSGGGAGGGTGTASGGAGGGGGAGAAVLFFVAGEIITGPSTPAGVVRARGGNGGAGASGGSANGGGSCGGAGGGGGHIYAAVGKRTGPEVVGFFDASGGNAGAVGAPTGTGTTATTSLGGQGGRITVLYLLGDTGVVQAGPANAVGATGGVVTADLEAA